jgi:hypothetical protein
MAKPNPATRANSVRFMTGIIHTAGKNAMGLNSGGI